MGQMVLVARLGVCCDDGAIRLGGFRRGVDGGDGGGLGRGGSRGRKPSKPSPQEPNKSNVFGPWVCLVESVVCLPTVQNSVDKKRLVSGESFHFRNLISYLDTAQQMGVLVYLGGGAINERGR